MDRTDERREAFSLRAWFIGGMVLAAVVISIIIRLRTGERDVGKMLGFAVFILTMFLLWWYFTRRERREQGTNTPDPRGAPHSSAEYQYQDVEAPK